MPSDFQSDEIPAESDEVWQQLRREAADLKKSEVARNRRKSNTGFKIQTMSARNEFYKRVRSTTGRHTKTHPNAEQAGVITAVRDGF